MSVGPSGSIILVRGATGLGRSVARQLRAAGKKAVVLDDRTCPHADVESVRVPFDEPAELRRTVEWIAASQEDLRGVVFLPYLPGTGIPAPCDDAWQERISREFVALCSIARSSGAALAAADGVGVLTMQRPVGDNDLVPLVARTCEPALRTIADVVGFRMLTVPIEGDATDQVGRELVTAIDDLQRRREPVSNAERSPTRSGRR